jgi:hypothetical protein
MPCGSLNPNTLLYPRCGVLRRENSSRRNELMSVTVPSVERLPPPSRFWSTTIAVERFSIRSASGWPSFGRKPRTNAENVSLSWRCASAAIVSKTSDDLPDPDTPTNAVICRFGIRTDTLRRLFSRAPVTMMNSCCIGLPRGWGGRCSCGT